MSLSEEDARLLKLTLRHTMEGYGDLDKYELDELATAVVEELTSGRSCFSSRHPERVIFDIVTTPVRP